MPNAQEVRHFRRMNAYRTIYTPHAPKINFDDKWSLHDHAGTHLGINSVINYLEFGVSVGHSLRKCAERFTNPATRLIGFDSFRGLPEDWQVGPERIIPKGHFSLGGAPPRIDDVRVSFVKGWFQNTVPGFLADSADDLAGKAVLVHFDADLYSATLFLLSILWLYIPEYYFIMDDFFEDDIIALHDFTMAYPVELEWIAENQAPSKFPSKVLGRLKRIILQVDGV